MALQTKLLSITDEDGAEYNLIETDAEFDDCGKCAFKGTKDCIDAPCKGGYFELKTTV